jgi:Domain of unknown function (DUF4382)
MKKISAVLLLIVLFLFISCDQNSQETGTVSLNITDAPVSIDGLIGVYITFTEITVKVAGTEDWLSLAVFEDGLTLNLLNLTEGVTEVIAADVELPSGQINQIRFMLDAPVEGETPGSNPGCYLEYVEGVTYPLRVPSGSESGFKGVNSFDVPVNGEVTVTADFDVRKSLVYSGGIYKLKPVIRLIVDNEAGKINGGLTVSNESLQYSVYAYEAGSYTDSEIEADADGVQFASAVSSSYAYIPEGETELRYKLAFLAEGYYDLIIASHDGAVDSELIYLDRSNGVSVSAGETTIQDINTISEP